MSRTLILGATVLALGSTWWTTRPANPLQANPYAAEFPAEPVIRAWHPWEERGVPATWPTSDREKMSQQAAIITPSGMEVVNANHKGSKTILDV
jgi:hypothetical protein